MPIRRLAVRLPAAVVETLGLKEGDMHADAFFDTSVLLYLLSEDSNKADRIEELLAELGTISVQVLNEVAAVALHKLRMPLSDVREVLGTVRAVCTVEPVTLATQERGLAIHERYGIALYDSMIIASALIAGGKAKTQSSVGERAVDRRLYSV